MSIREDATTLKRPSNSGTPSSPDVAARTPRESVASNLLDVLSPGRELRWRAPLFVRIPRQNEFVPKLGVCYFVIARWTGQNGGLGEGAVLGYRADLVSGFAWQRASGQSSPSRTHTPFGAARIAQVFDTELVQESELYPYTCGAGSAAIVLASAREYSKWTTGSWQTDSTDNGLSFAEINNTLASNGFAANMPEHRVDLPLPNGDMSAATTLPLNRWTLTSRDQPFGARINADMPLVVALAVDSRYVIAAQAALQLAGTNARGFFPVKASGSFLFAPSRDDRRLQQV